MSDAMKNLLFNSAQLRLDASHTASHVKTVQETNGLDLKNYADYPFDTMSKFVGDSATCKKDIAKIIKKLHGVQVSQFVNDQFYSL